jgi:hypothetical protein
MQPRIHICVTFVMLMYPGNCGGTHVFSLLRCLLVFNTSGDSTLSMMRTRHAPDVKLLSFDFFFRKNILVFWGEN